MPTIALNMIVKDEFEEVARIIGQAIDYFDEINLTVSDKTTANKLNSVSASFNGDQEHLPKVSVKYREWNDRFDEARTANFAMCTTDYAFWVDSDDTFDFSTIPELLDITVENDLDVLFLPYNYAQDERGVCVTRQYRERLLKMSSGFIWKGWVHETPIWPTTNYKSHIMDSPEVKHSLTAEHMESSVNRNHAILEDAYTQTDDPRYAYYYGMSLFSLQEYEKSMVVLNDYLKRGASTEDIYRALSVISECAYHLKQYNIAMEYAAKCVSLKPAYPMGYYLFAQYEADQGNWNEAIEWVKVALSKPEPRTVSVWDPSARERAVLIAAQADFMLGNHNSALAWLRKIPKNPATLDLIDDFAAEADLETFINILPRIGQYFNGADKLWGALHRDVQYDPRLQSLRFRAQKPKHWPKDSIVIFCGEGYEEWGPQTLDKGMGGSEEAVVYLSRELAKLGWSVTVFGEIPHDLPDQKDGVTWLNWKEIDKRDKFNVLIGWRAPQYLEVMDAKVKLADIHDIIPESIVKDMPNTTYMFKSNYQKDIYKDLPANSSVVIGNGIAKEQFNV